MTENKNNNFNEQTILQWLRLIRSENVGPITFNKLLEMYGNAESALDALPEMAKKGGRKKPLVLYPEDKAMAEIKALKKYGGEFIIKMDARYPLNLMSCDDSPPVLAVIGNPDLLNTTGIAIVGGRNASAAGQDLSRRFAHELGEAGYPIVSGLARGIDTAAHKGSLKYGTIAVVAGGIDVIYPEENTDLYHEIVKHGLVVSENPFGTQPQRHFFPKRNRIIAGLSRGVVVIEGRKKSGSLITAKVALDYGREIYAVPGSPLDARSYGANHLIQTSAALLVNSAKDVLDHIEFSSQTTLRESEFENPFLHKKPIADELGNIDDNLRQKCQEDILSCLSVTPVQIDQIIRQTGITPALAQAILLELELAGSVRRDAGGLISLTLK